MPAHLDQNFWIKVDPITIDENSRSVAERAGRLAFNISGKTTYPRGTLLTVQIFDELNSRGVRSASLQGNPFCAVEGGNVTQTFSCTFHIDEISSSDYRIELHPLIRQNQSIVSNYTATTRFTTRIVRKEPFVSINPPVWSHKDQVLNVTGTTSASPGSFITVTSGMMVHPCPTPGMKDTGETRTWCGGGCDDTISTKQVYVTEDSRGQNTWAYQIDTAGWCTREYYFVTAKTLFQNETIQDSDEF